MPQAHDDFIHRLLADLRRRLTGVERGLHDVEQRVDDLESEVDLLRDSLDPEDRQSPARRRHLRIVRRQ